MISVGKADITASALTEEPSLMDVHMDSIASVAEVSVSRTESTDENAVPVMRLAI